MPAAALTLAMLVAQGFAPQKCLVDGRERTVYAARFDTTDDFVLDTVGNAAGAYLAEEDLAGARLMVFVDDRVESLTWRLECPVSKHRGLERRYRLPDEEAYAVRLLNDHLGVKLPVAVVRLGDQYSVIDDGLCINGRPVTVVHPRATSITSAGTHCGRTLTLCFRGEDGRIHQTELECVVGHWA